MEENKKRFTGTRNNGKTIFYYYDDDDGIYDVFKKYNVRLLSSRFKSRSI